MSEERQGLEKVAPACAVRLAIESPDAELAEVEVLALARELRSVRGIVVGRPSAAGPADAKSGTASILGTLSISLASGGVAPMMMMVHEWVKRRRRPCSVSMLINGATVTFPEIDLDEALAMLKNQGLGGSAEGVRATPLRPANDDI
jgi:hypothetical protein